MQILELYIRDGIKYPAFGVRAATSTSTDNLVDSTADFTTGVKVGYIVFNKTGGTTAKVTAVTNATTLALSDDIFVSGEQYQIKSDFTRLDLFEDESITITDSIKNTKDISKVFTPFSQQFNVPASKHNSKLFKHYEDSDVTNSFDARFRIDALIKLNGVDYKKGKLRLTSVSLKNNKAHSYKLVFFGETVELKDILGDDDLTRLQFESSLNFAYDHSTIKSKFINVDDVCFPLITHSKNMRLDNNGYKSTTGTFLNEKDIKPAIKVRKIIDAINRTYDLNLSNDFFNTTDFNNLYMWMHRESGFMSNSTEGGGLQILEGRFHLNTDTDFDFDSGTEVRPFEIIPPEFAVGPFTPQTGERLKINFVITAGATDQYNITIQRSSNNEVLFDQDLTGPLNTEVIFTGAGGTGVIYGEGILDIKIVITTTNTLTFTEIQLIATAQSHNFMGNFSSDLYSGTYTLSALATSNQVIISRQIPKIKVIDFLTNLFKMFNLVAFKENDEIRVLSYNDFNAQFTTYDITEYVDTSKSTIKKILQYKNVKFDFKSKVSFLVQNQQELLGNNFAGESYPPTNDNEWDGSDFKIELDFEKMLYERLSNTDTGALSTICQGAMLDKNFDATIGKPLLLYIERQFTATTLLTFQNSSDSSTENLTHYNRPSQVFVSSGSQVQNFSPALNFGIEIDEFFRQVKGTNLFAKYYADYLSSIYNRQGRLKKVEACLPLHILLNYKLSDRFLIGNKNYRINSIKTNLLTNKSSLELYSLSESATADAVSSALPRVASTSVTTKGTDFITIGWTALADPTGKNITGYDVLQDDLLISTLANTANSNRFGSLTSGFTYKLAVRVRYTISSNVVFSQDTIIFVTTDPPPTVLSENGDTLITEGSDTIILE